MARGLAAMVLLVGLVAGPAVAQHEPVDFSLKGGINFADLVIEPDSDLDAAKLLRFGAGGSLAMNLSPKLSITTDVLYLMKGQKTTFTNGNELDGSEIDSKLKLDYIVVSPNFRVSPASQGTNPYFLVGPEFGFLVKAESEWDMGDAGSSKQDVKDEFKTTDFGVNFGAGLEFNSGSSSFFIEGRYCLGLTDISDTQEHEGDESDGSVKTRGIYAFAGIRF